MLGSSKHISGAVYIDFDNFWNGTLAKAGVFENPEQLYELHEPIRNFLKKFAKELYSGIELQAVKTDSSDDTLSLLLERLYFKTKYIKAFADFSALPYRREIFSLDENSIGIIQYLHNIGIEPISPFVKSSKSKKRVKDASDRALILEIIEDVFFQDKYLEAIIIISGDIDYYPLVSFLKEHSNKKIYICSFEDRINKVYHFNPMTSDNILIVDKFQSCKSFAEEIRKIKSNLEIFSKDKDIDSLYQAFKKNVVKGIKSWKKNHPDKPVKSGLILTSWCPNWVKSGKLQRMINVQTLNKFLFKMQNEGIISLTKPPKGKGFIINLQDN